VPHAKDAADAAAPQLPDRCGPSLESIRRMARWVEATSSEASSRASPMRALRRSPQAHCFVRSVAPTSSEASHLRRLERPTCVVWTSPETSRQRRAITLLPMPDRTTLVSAVGPTQRGRVRNPTLRLNRWLRLAVALALFAVVTATIPRWWCGQDGERWYRGDQTTVVGLAREVAATLQRDVSTDEFTSSSALFRHEWQFGTYQMGALGLLQVCREHPGTRAEFLPVIERAIDHLLSPQMRRFDAQAWGEDPIDSLDGPNDHAAYLGYLNLVLAVHRRVAPDSRFAALNERITAAFVRRFRAAPARILQTYPGEAYPIDNAAGLAAVLLHVNKTEAERACVADVLERYCTTWRDRTSGLLCQALAVSDGRPLDAGRASGTALAAYFLSFGERDISQQLFASLRSQMAGSALGFGYINEYADGSANQHSDIDSGPVIFGISTSGTGFTLATSRVFADRDLFVNLSRTAYLIGTPVSQADRRGFVTGGPLGNAILLAMLTAQPTPL
jgi:hypothetical protein